MYLLDEDGTMYKEWLKYNVEPFDTVILKWEYTFNIRKQFLREKHSLNEILEEWPSYKYSYGNNLVIY